MKTILCVEDEVLILENNIKALTDAGYNTLTAESLAEAREILTVQRVDAIVLDIMLPDGNGLNLLSELRSAGNKVPVIMLTAWGEPKDVERGLKLGANDYVTKPFTYGVLLARLEAMFRNVEQIPEAIQKDGIILKPRSMEIQFAGQKVKLPPVEFFMLQLLVEDGGKILSSEYIYEQVWGTDMANDPTAVRNTISRLRKKIEGSGYIINSVYGGSYCFEKV